MGLGVILVVLPECRFRALLSPDLKHRRIIAKWRFYIDTFTVKLLFLVCLLTLDTLHCSTVVIVSLAPVDV